MGGAFAKSRQPQHRSSSSRHPIAAVAGTSSSPQAEPEPPLTALPPVDLESPPRWPLVHARAVAAIVESILNRRDAQKVVGPDSATAVAGTASLEFTLVVALLCRLSSQRPAPLLCPARSQ